MIETLTNHQLRIGLLLAEGLANKQIARKIGVKPETVAKALREIYRKLGVHNRVQCAVLVTRDQREQNNPPPPNQHPLWHSIIHQETAQLKATDTTTNCAHAALDMAALLADVLAGLTNRIEALESKC